MQFPTKKTDRHLEDYIREDGRVEVYDVPKAPDGRGYQCFICDTHPDTNGHRYDRGSVFICSPINTPDAQPKFICINHVPDTVVIYDPVSNTCRDKTGQNTWSEGGIAVDLKPS